MTAKDPRLHAYRKDLADINLRGIVFAHKYVRGKPAYVVISHAALRGAPNAGASQTTQLVMGDEVTVFDSNADWAWVQSVRDGYVGYAVTRTIGERKSEPTHVVSAPRTFLYPSPDLKAPRTDELPMGAEVTVNAEVVTRGTEYALLDNWTACVASHLRPINLPPSDYVSIAETLIYTPYLWGGVTSFGIDCSGLVQMSMRMIGKTVLRDTDMQVTTIGEELDPGKALENLRRGDLVFWKGHVAIMTDDKNIIHASGHTMMVSREPLKAAIERIGYLYGAPTAFRRP